MFTIACCLAVGLGLLLGSGLDLVGKLLCTRICANSGCNCHERRLLRHIIVINLPNNDILKNKHVQWKHNSVSKMAVASPLVLCDVLCFLHSKQGTLNVKQLKSALMEFYTPEDISVAKIRLLDDIRRLNSTIKLPHVPQMRDGDQRLVREVNDIMLLLSRLDEHKLLDELPRYVSSSPDNMPSVRLYEGEFNGLITMLKRMDNTISQMGSKLAAIARDVRDLQARPPEQFPCNRGQL